MTCGAASPVSKGAGRTIEGTGRSLADVLATESESATGSSARSAS